MSTKKLQHNDFTHSLTKDEFNGLMNLVADPALKSSFNGRCVCLEIETVGGLILAPLSTHATRRKRYIRKEEFIARARNTFAVTNS